MFSPMSRQSQWDVHPSLPLSPPPYTTDNHSRMNLGLATSTVWNERGLEAPYYPCYVNALQTCLGSVSNRYTASTQTALYIPGPQMNAFKHKLKGQELEQAQEEIVTLVDAEQPKDEGKRRSSRNQDMSAFKLHKLLVTCTAAAEAWNREKPDEPDTEAETAMGFEDGDVSLGNIPQSDKDAKDSVPDLLVHYVVAGEIDEPTLQHVQEYYPDLDTPDSQQEQLEFLRHHHAIRAGIQVAFRCCVLIGEIKALSIPKTFQRGAQGDPLFSKALTSVDTTNPSRPSNKRQPTTPNQKLSKLNTWASFLSVEFSNAVKQVMFYCAVHFFTQKERDKVVVLPAIGPYWRWGWASRQEIPAYDWTTGEVMDTPKDQEKAASFKRRFSWGLGSCYIFGTHESDRQFTAIRKDISSVFGFHPNPNILPTKYNFRLLKDEPLILPPFVTTSS